MAMSQVLDLYRLQKIDSRQEQISVRLGEIDRILAEDLELIQAQTQSEIAYNTLQNLRKDLKTIEGSVQTQQIKIEQSNAALYGGRIHNPKELQDIQSEVISLKRHLSTLEDQQIEVMIQVEQAEAFSDEMIHNLNSVQDKVRIKQNQLFEEQKILLKEIERLNTEHQSLVSFISPDYLKMYDRLRQQKKGLAITTATDSSCDSCGATLTPAEWQTTHSPNKITYCPSCGRILFPG